MLHFGRWKRYLILSLSVASIMFSLPNFFTPAQLLWVPDFIPQWRLSLGLDLQGGSHLLLEVDEKEIVGIRLAKLSDSMRDILRKERIGYANLEQKSGNVVTVRIRSPDQIDAARKILSNFVISESNLSGGAVREINVNDDGNGFFKLSLTPEGLQNLKRSVIERSIEVIRRRIDQLGTVDPTIQRQGNARIMVQVPGLYDPERLKVLLGSTARLTFRLVDSSASVSDALEGRISSRADLVRDMSDPPRFYVLEKREIVTGEHLVDAHPGFSQYSNEPVVSFRFDVYGAKRFAETTQKHVGRLFAIVLDDQVISAPVIREPILGGSGQISGNFTVEEARDLSILLKAGALPAKLSILEERTVGAGLGADQIRSGVIAVCVGSVAVLIFMFLSYGLFGLFSNIALIINVSMIISALSILGATLTLPGIAGIVLTIGMAVDANVLIFERIREEWDAGNSLVKSIDSGFARALGAILDANITTLIATLVLFYLGAGPIRGFAVTLSIGIVTSVFTAFVLSRLFIALWVRRYRPTIMPI